MGKDFCEENQIIKAIKKLEKQDLAFMKSLIDQNNILKEIIENNEIKDKFEEIMKENEKLKKVSNIWKKKYEKVIKEKNELMMYLDDDVPKKSKIKIKDDETGEKKKLQKHYPPIKYRQKK